VNARAKRDVFALQSDKKIEQNWHVFFVVIERKTLYNVYDDH
jgi:hypothetical protein